MANIDSIDMKNDKIMVKLEIKKDEYNLLHQTTKNLLLLPTDSGTLRELLTTGKLGNSNRIMLPSKLLNRHSITKMLKNAPSQIFDIDDEKFLLVKLQESTIGKPIFGDGK